MYLFIYLFIYMPKPGDKRNSTPTRPVENVALTTKGLQERKQNIQWDDGRKIGNKNK